MMRLLNLVLLGVVIAAATWTYQVKHEAEAKLAEIRALENQIALEKETIELLKADWAKLSHPARLQTLADRYNAELGLAVTDSNQIIEPTELPDAPIFDAGDGIGDLIAGETDNELTTGSVDAGNGN